ncbi:purine NTPase [Methanococcus maripaludis]|uniref:Possible purine NTPase n=1 Tax=Methanococcus maripaludis (strain DSM 14266 / JCM 13030 / NBRC 101832 / S2 / LL) TaxID=267377 RepID=Q6LZ89_METMP|nr:purine NTPase [Methanococcus maripaludis]CAF30296.1 possible purine NTPase [Methanococcus maripaludis S2]
MRIILDKIRKTIENNNESGKNILDTDKITLELGKLDNKVNGISKELKGHSKTFKDLEEVLPEYFEDTEKNTKKIQELGNTLDKILKYIEQEKKIKEQQDLKIKELEKRINDLEEINKNWTVVKTWMDNRKTNEKINSEKLQLLETKFNGIEKYINTERYKKTIKRETDNEQVLSILKNGCSQPKDLVKNFKGGTKALYDTLKRLEKSSAIIRKKDGKQVFYELKQK